MRRRYTYRVYAGGRLFIFPKDVNIIIIVITAWVYFFGSPGKRYNAWEMRGAVKTSAARFIFTSNRRISQPGR